MKGGQFFRIEERGCIGMITIQFAGLPPGFPDLCAGCVEHRLVVCVFPNHQVFNDFEKPLPLLRSFYLVDAAVEVPFITGIVHKLSEEHCPRSRERSPRPPEMQSAGMAVADGLLSRCRHIDLVERQCHFDEFARTLDCDVLA